MNLEIANTFINADLPTLGPLAPQIKALASFRGWFQFAEDTITTDESGKIASVPALAGSGAFLATSDSRPTLVSGVLRNDFSAGNFDGSAEMYASGVTLDLSQPFTAVLIFKPLLDAANTTAYLSTYTDAAHNFIVTNSKETGQVQVAIGSNSIPALVPTDGKFHIIVLAVNGLTLKASGDGVRKTDVTFSDGYGPGSGLLRLCGLSGFGASWRAKCQLADLVLFQEDLFLAGATARLKLPADFARYIYGVGV